MDFYDMIVSNDRRIRAPWRILLMVLYLLLFAFPLSLLPNTLMQFFGAALILTIGLWLGAMYIDKRNFTDYGLVLSKTSLGQFLAGTVIGSVAVLLILVMGMSLGVLKVVPQASLPNFHNKVSFLVQMTLVAFLEEAFFRGYLYTNLLEAFTGNSISRYRASIIALLFSSLLFGMAHFTNDHVTPISLTFLAFNGIVWCIPFILTKNLGLSIGMHLAWNFTQTILGFNMSGNAPTDSLFSIENEGTIWFTGGNYGPESGALGFLGYAIMLVMALAFIKLVKIKVRD